MIRQVCSNSGPGDIITVDHSEEAIAGAKTGDIVLVEMGNEVENLLLRGFWKRLLITNRAGNKSSKKDE